MDGDHGKYKIFFNNFFPQIFNAYRHGQLLAGKKLFRIAALMAGKWRDASPFDINDVLMAIDELGVEASTPHYNFLFLERVVPLFNAFGAPPYSCPSTLTDLAAPLFREIKHYIVKFYEREPEVFDHESFFANYSMTDNQTRLERLIEIHAKTILILKEKFILEGELGITTVISFSRTHSFLEALRDASGMVV